MKQYGPYVKVKLSEGGCNRDIRYIRKNAIEQIRFIENGDMFLVMHDDYIKLTPDNCKNLDDVWETLLYLTEGDAEPR